MTIFGEGEFTYEIDSDWAKLPPGFTWREVSSVAVDRNDRVYVFNRGEHPMMVFDREGRFIKSWGEGVFTKPHGAQIGPDDTIFLTDDGDHTVRKCTLDGKVLLELGTSGKPAPYMSLQPFHRCTHTALAPNGDIYVSDGYGNAAIHKYSPDGRHLFTWGTSGTRQGQFNLPHNICCDPDGWVYVADRENHRIQVFDGNGRYETQWNNLHRPSALCLPAGGCPFCYVGECGPTMRVNRAAPNLGPRVSVLDREGKLLASIGGAHAGNENGSFISPHGIAVDSHGDVYVAEVSASAWPQLYPDAPPPSPLRTLRKMRRIRQGPAPSTTQRSTTGR